MRVLFGVIIAVVAATAFGGQWTDWQWATPRPQGHTLRSAAQGDGITVVVGNYGTILVKQADQDSWEIARSGYSYSLRSVIWTGERFIAVGGEYQAYGGLIRDAIVLTSEDGREWTERVRMDGPEFMPTEAIWNGSQVVAVGLGNFALISPDGLHWRTEELDGIGQWYQFMSIAWTGDAYVANGYTVYWQHSLRRILVSSDGVVWEVQDPDAEMDFTSLAAGNGLVVVMGGNAGTPKVLISSDAVDWTMYSPSLPTVYDHIIFDGVQFVAAGLLGRLAFSADGISWTTTDLGLNRRVSSISWLGDSYLAVGDEGMIENTSDGTSWQPLIERDISLNGARVWDLAQGSEQYVGVTWSGDVFAGSPESGWNTSTLPPSRLHRVERLENRFLATGRSVSIYASENGTSWESIFVDDNRSDYHLWGVASSEGRIVAVGGDWTEAIVVTGNEEMGWMTLELSDIHSFLHAVVWTGDRFVAGGSGGVIATSPDGLSWRQEESTLGGNLGIERIARNDECIVAIARNNGFSAIATSPDGLTWQSIVVDGLLQDVVWTGKFFVAINRTADFSSDDLWTSRNGLDWTQDRIGHSFSATAVEGNEEQLVLAGPGGMIITAKHVSVVPRQGGRRMHSGGP